MWTGAARCGWRHSSSSRMRVINHNWSATKQRLHPQSVAAISRHSVLSGQDSTMWDRVWVSPQGSVVSNQNRSVFVSRHFFLQAPQCPCSVRKRFSRDHCCWGRSKHYSTLINDRKVPMAEQLSQWQHHRLDSGLFQLVVSVYVASFKIIITTDGRVKFLNSVKGDGCCL